LFIYFLLSLFTSGYTGQNVKLTTLNVVRVFGAQRGIILMISLYLCILEKYLFYLTMNF